MTSMSTTTHEQDADDEDWAERGVLIMVETMQRLGHSESEIWRAVRDAQGGAVEASPVRGLSVLRRVLGRRG